jgi:Zn-dependent M32 family carboxypeptidase
MLATKVYNEWTSEEKVSSFKEYIEKRIEIFPEFSKNWEQQNGYYKELLQKLNDRIETTKDDEFLNNILTQTATNFRSQWNKEIKNYEFDKERMEQQLPQLEALYMIIDTVDRNTLVLFIDLFLSMTLVDWENQKNIEKESE